MVSVATMAQDLPPEQQEGFCEEAARLAWLNNVTIVVVGDASPDKDHALLHLCVDGCQLMRPGVLVVVPDVDVVQLGHVPEGSMTIERAADHRTAYAFPGVAR
jgi:hypothetical protein